MTPPLSANAQCKRWNDMEKIVVTLDQFAYLSVATLGASHLLEAVMGKLSPRQRAALYTVVWMTGGVGIVISMATDNVPLGIFIGLLLGALLILIAKI